MYKPVRPRPTKTNIVRARTGCTACRQRRSKCDEQKPTCGRCLLQKKTCEYKTHFQFRHTNKPLVTKKPKKAPLTNHSPVIGAVGRDLGERKKKDGTVNRVPGSGSPPFVAGANQANTGGGCGLTAADAGWVLGPESACCETAVGTTRCPADINIAGISYPKPLPPYMYYGDIGPSCSWPTVVGFAPGEEAVDFEQPQLWQDAGRSNAPEVFEQNHVFDPLYMLNGAATTGLPGCPDITTDLVTVPSTTPRSAEDVNQDAISLPGASRDFDGNMTASVIERDSLPDRKNICKSHQLNLLSNVLVPADVGHGVGSSSLLDMRYLAYWQTDVLQALPPVFQELTPVLYESRAMRKAALAIAACNIGRRWPEIKVGSSTDENPSLALYRPSHAHQHRSQEYYLSAISDLANLPRPQLRAEVVTTLATWLLCSYVEIGTGNFGGFRLHLRGVERLLSTQQHALSCDSTLHKLLGVWVRLRTYQWFQQVPWVCSDFGDGSHILSANAPTLRVYGMRRDMITQILAESYRLSCQCLLARVPKCKMSSAYRQKAGLVPDAYRDNSAQLRKQRDLLGDWHAMLKSCDLPIEAFSPWRFEEPSAVEGVAWLVEPLRFQSHEAAMSYAYYIGALVLQDVDFLDVLLLEPPEATEAGTAGNINPWILVLLRITAGLSLEDCARQNAYMVGITTLLLICVLRCGSISVGRWVETWLSQFQSLSNFEEGGVPILQTLDIIRTLNGERMEGRDVFFAADSDREDNLRLESYSCQNITSLEVYGRSRHTAHYFHENIAIVSR